MELLFIKRSQQRSFPLGLIWMMMFCILISSLCGITSLHAGREASKQPFIDDFAFDRFSVLRTMQELKPYAVICAGSQLGFFSEFFTALGALRLYEQGVLSGVSIEYGTTGAYYDSAVGLNWWEYYFEPLHVGGRNNSQLVDCHQEILIHGVKYIFPLLAELHTCRKDAHQLIKKYVKVKPHIKRKVKQIIENSFGYGSIIGVHYRGTDKYGEVPLLPYENVAAYLDETIVEFQKIGHSDVKIFVATDEQSFLDYMRGRYPSQVICYEESERSVDGNCLHRTRTGGTPYKKGEDALIDCLLLSKTDILIRTSSNLSLCSSYFNPEIPVVDLTIRPIRTIEKDGVVTVL